MEYQEFIDFCKDKIVETYPDTNKDDLENFYQANLMELKRVMFRVTNAEVLYQVTYNTITEAIDIIKYIEA